MVVALHPATLIMGTYMHFVTSLVYVLIYRLAIDAKVLIQTAQFSPISNAIVAVIVHRFCF